MNSVTRIWWLLTTVLIAAASEVHHPKNICVISSHLSPYFLPGNVPQDNKTKTLSTVLPGKTCGILGHKAFPAERLEGLHKPWRVKGFDYLTADTS